MCRSALRISIDTAFEAGFWNSIRVEGITYLARICVGQVLLGYELEIVRDSSFDRKRLLPMRGYAEDVREQ